jgi:hypothetical protein
MEWNSTRLRFKNPVAHPNACAAAASSQIRPGSGTGSTGQRKAGTGHLTSCRLVRTIDREPVRSLRFVIPIVFGLRHPENPTSEAKYDATVVAIQNESPIAVAANSGIVSPLDKRDEPPCGAQGRSSADVSAPRVAQARTCRPRRLRARHLGPMPDEAFSRLNPIYAPSDMTHAIAPIQNENLASRNAGLASR